jgi:HSP20 family protein
MATLIRINPLERAVANSADLNRQLFEDVFRGPAVWSRPTRAADYWNGRLPLDAYATEHEIVVQAAFPGIAPENVQVTVDQDTLTLSAELPGRLENVEYAVAERPHGKFSRQLSLNVAVDVEKAEAVFENGLLTLTLPKAETARPKTIAVTAK